MKRTLKIVNVTDHNGNPKPKRIGRVVTPLPDGDERVKNLAHFGEQVFEYVDGAGIFITSPVMGVTMNGERIVTMTTKNSIYTFEEVENAKNKGQQE